MGMTEQQAIKRIKAEMGWESEELNKEAFSMGIKALEEIQEYRAIGTVEELEEIKQWKSDVVEGFCKYDASSIDELVRNVRNKAIDDFAKKLKERMEDTRWTTIFDTSCIFENDKLDKCIKIVDEIAEQMKEV